MDVRKVGATTFVVRDLPASYVEARDPSGVVTSVKQETPAQYSVYNTAPKTPWGLLAAAVAAWMYFK